MGDKDRDTKRFGTCVNTCVKKTNAPTTNPNEPKKTNYPKKKKKPKRPKKTKNNRLTKRLGLRRPNGRAYHDICKISCKDERPVKGAQMRLAVKYIKCLNNCEVRKKECKINCRMDKDRVPKKLRTCVNSCVKRVYLPLESKPETKKTEIKKPKTKKPKKKKPKKKKPKKKKPKKKKPKTKKPKPSYMPTAAPSISLKPTADIVSITYQQSFPSSDPSLVIMNRTQIAAYENEVEMIASPSNPGVTYKCTVLDQRLISASTSRKLKFAKKRRLSTQKTLIVIFELSVTS